MRTLAIIITLVVCSVSDAQVIGTSKADSISVAQIKLMVNNWNARHKVVHNDTLAKVTPAQWKLAAKKYGLPLPIFKLLCVYNIEDIKPGCLGIITTRYAVAAPGVLSTTDKVKHKVSGLPKLKRGERLSCALYRDPKKGLIFVPLKGLPSKLKSLSTD